MPLPANILKEFRFSTCAFKIWVPDQTVVQQLHLSTPGVDFPFWAKVWSSSMGMIEFLEQYPQYIEGKEVLEIAAGIGLPSFYAASKAHTVVCSDYMHDAIQLMLHNIEFLHAHNMSAMYLDWNQIPIESIPETVLMCDVNYHSDSFDALFNCIKTILRKGSTLLLATPQRLVARSFVEKLLPWSVENKVMAVNESSEQVLINILVLKQAHLEI